MQCGDFDPALVMLEQVSVALADELDKQYTGRQLHRGATFEKVVLLGQVMLLLQSRGIPIPEKVEKLGRKVANPARAPKPPKQ